MHLTVGSNRADACFADGWNACLREVKSSFEAQRQHLEEARAERDEYVARLVIAVRERDEARQQLAEARERLDLQRQRHNSRAEAAIAERDEAIADAVNARREASGALVNFARASSEAVNAESALAALRSKLETLPRHTVDWRKNDLGYLFDGFRPEAGGGWVRWADVEPLLAADPAQAITPASPPKDHL